LDDATERAAAVGVQGVPTYEGRPLANPDEDIFDQGLTFDLETVVGRRQLLKLIGSAGIGAGMFMLTACVPSGSGTSAAASASASATTSPTGSAAASQSSAASVDASASREAIPEETAGPYPGDGSNGPNMLTESGIVRSDIRSCFGSASGVADGVPLTIRLRIQDQANGCVPLVGAAVYLWHCDREGRYSLYSNGVTNENYLRGVQETDGEGVVTFESIFPACYAGRWPHIHFEVYRSLDEATDQANRIATSQVALPQDACDQVYATDGYEQSVTNLGQVSLDRDNVFGEDGGARQLGTVTGSVDAAYVVELATPVSTA
jgi:protocatechuate 3,4-dioxygenase beta subunit